MSTISVSALSGIMDRIGGQAQLLKFAINSGLTGTPYYNRVYTSVGPIGDYTVEGPLITDAHNLDINSVSGTLFKAVYNSFLQDLQTQVVTNGAASFDSFLTISGGLGSLVHAPVDFEDVWYQCIGSHLSAVNVFFKDSNIKVASYTVISSGVGTFTHNQAVGTGTGNFANGTTNYAPAKMVLVPIQAVTSDIQVSMYLTRQNPAGGTTVASSNVLIPAGAVSGLQFIVNNISGQYLDVTNIIAAGGGGTDSFNVYALRERGTGL